MRNKQVTIKDLARKLDISTSTVSRALRGEPDVNPETSKKVKQLAKELNYKVNDIALSLISKQTHTIGVIIPGYIIYFYAQALSGIQEAARKAGYHIIIMQTNDSMESEKECVEMLIHKRVDGILLSLSSETGSRDYLNELIKKEIPLVLFNRVSRKLKVPKVFVDDSKGGYLATKHLIEQGCEKILHIGGPQKLQMSQQRLQGYKKALLEAGLVPEKKRMTTSDFSRESGYIAMQNIWEAQTQIDGVFAICDAVAFGVIQFLKEKGIAIPKQVAVIGFTDEPMNKLIEPQLSSIAQPIEAIGKTALTSLVEAIKKKTIVEQEIKLDVQLQKRASSVRQ